MVNRKIAAVALFLFVGVRALVLPAVVRAEVARACPQARFGSLSFSVFLGRVTLEDVTLVDADGRALLAARSASAPLRRDPGKVTLEEVTLVEGTDPVLHRFRVDRALLELADGKLAGVTLEASFLDENGTSLAQARLGVRIESPAPEALSVRFETSVTLGRTELFGLAGSAEVNERRVHFQLASSGGGLRMNGGFELAEGAFDWRHGLREVTERLPELHALVRDKVQETKALVHDLLK